MRLMNKDVYKATFPLHEGRYDKDGPQGEKSDRRVRSDYSLPKLDMKILFLKLLFLEWAHWKNFYKKQPLWLIKRYFGDKVSDCVAQYLDSLPLVSDWTVFCMVGFLQPTVDNSSLLWNSRVSFWSHDCSEPRC